MLEGKEMEIVSRSGQSKGLKRTPEAPQSEIQWSLSKHPDYEAKKLKGMNE